MSAKPGNGADAADAGVVADGADAQPPAKRTPGRPKGSPKVPGSGRRKGVPNTMGKEARVYLAAESGYLDVIARVCKGLPIRLAGPTGKRRWHYPDWPDLRWAVELVSSKCIATMSAAELSGPDGEPLHPPEYSDREWARRIAFVLRRGDTEGRSEVQATQGSAGESHVPGRSGGVGTATRRTLVPSPDRSNGTADAAAKGGGGPRADLGASEPHQHPVSGF